MVLKITAAVLASAAGAFGVLIWRRVRAIAQAVKLAEEDIPPAPSSSTVLHSIPARHLQSVLKIGPSLIPLPSLEGELEGTLYLGEHDLLLSSLDPSELDPSEETEESAEEGSELEEGGSGLEEGRSGLEEGRSGLKNGRSELEKGRSGLEEGGSEPEEGSSRPEKGRSGLEEGRSGLKNGRSELEEGGSEPEEGRSRPEKGNSGLEEGRFGLEEGRSGLKNGRSELEKGRSGQEEDNPGREKEQKQELEENRESDESEAEEDSSHLVHIPLVQVIEPVFLAEFKDRVPSRELQLLRIEWLRGEMRLFSVFELHCERHVADALRRDIQVRAGKSSLSASYAAIVSASKKVPEQAELS